jgi:hypothetical protein
MTRTVTSKGGKVISLCSYNFTNPDGKVETCNAHAACPVCGQCSRFDGEHERGHCTGHFGLDPKIPFPGSEGQERLNRQKS